MFTGVMTFPSRLVLSSAPSIARPMPCLTGPTSRPVGRQFNFNAPNALRDTLTGRFRSAFGAQGSHYFRAQSPAPLPRPADGVVILEPLWERPAGTQTYSRRTGWRLGRLCCARQEIVRVPKSNTKYGGKRGITGVNAAAVIDQVSVSPRGFESQKLSPRPPIHPSLCCAPGKISLRLRLLRRRTHLLARREVSAGMPAKGVARGADRRQGYHPNPLPGFLR